jgi:hypothetical protein
VVRLFRYGVLVDLEAVLSLLNSERDKLDDAIRKLEQLTVQSIHAVGPKRRGRKSMDPEARAEVSRRMKRYWAQRRKSRAQCATAS